MGWLSDTFGGKQERAQETRGERQLREMGTKLDERGRALRNPNLLRLKEVTRLTDEDRANAHALAKAQQAAAGGQTIPNMLGLRATQGVNSNAFRLGLEDATSAAGNASVATGAGTDEALNKMDLENNAALIDVAMKGSGDALTGLRSGVATGGANALLELEAANKERLERASRNTQLLQMGLKGASMAGAKAGTFIDEKGNVGYEDGFFGGLARLGLADDATMQNKIKAYIADKEGFEKGGERNSLFGGFGEWAGSFGGDGALKRWNTDVGLRRKAPTFEDYVRNIMAGG